MPEVDAAIVEELTFELFEMIKEHYMRGPTDRSRVLEVLNALAYVTGAVLTGTEDVDAYDFFEVILQDTLDKCGGRAKQ